MIRTRIVPIVIGTLLICMAFSLSALAQTAGGSISGTVTDPSGAAIPGAEVVIINTATGVSRTLTTNDSGFFSVPNLLPGSYEVKTSATGFGSVLQKLDLNVGAEAVADAQLQVGDVTNTVMVESGAAAIDQGTSTLAAAVEGRTIRELPLNGRDWTQLAILEPGVSAISTQNPTVLGNAARANRGLGTQLTVGGARPQQNNYRLDGISINDYSGGGPGNTIGSLLGVEAIAEYSVVTANPSGEYGKTSGGVFNAVTRSGANEFHGSGYEFHRNSAFDARNFFDGAVKPPFRRHQFGASIGGPIRKDRTFFFFDYEGQREFLATTNVITVPSLAQRAGTVHPAVAPFLRFFPLPNLSPTTAGVVQNTSTSENFFTGRVDHTISQADSMHGTFFYDNAQTSGPDNFTLTQLANISKRRMISLEETHIFSPSVINIARIGYSRVAANAPRALAVLDPRAQDPAFAFIAGRSEIGSINVSGLTLFPGLQSQASDFYYNSYQAYDDLFWTRGSHAIKMGFAFERMQLNEFSPANPNGVWQFGSVANFLANIPNNFQASIPQPESPIYLRQSMVAGYVQDDWRARPNLTLNLGLRYEMATVLKEKYERLATLTTLTSPRPKLGSPYYENPTLRNFSPRVGFAWDPFKDGKTSVRGAFGLYDTLPLIPLFEVLTLVQAPFSRVGLVTNPAQLRNQFPLGGNQFISPESDRVSYVEQNPKRSYVMQWNLNGQREIGKDLVVQLGYVGSRGVHQPFRTQDADIVLPTVTGDGYFWPTPRGSGTKLNPNVGQIAALAWMGSTSYHAMNVKVTQRLTHGLQGGIAYTWSKSIDNNSATVVGGQYANSINGLPLQFANLWKGLSDFDVRHNLVVNYLWEIPSVKSDNSVVHTLTNGWQWGGIIKAQSGVPFSVTIGGDSLGMRSNNPFNFPDRVNSPECRNPVNPGDNDNYIKKECFVVPTPNNRMGNAGRNSFIGPGLVNLDMSLVKNNRITSISEAFNFQIRFEVFNVLNHANFRPPTAAAGQVFTVNFVPNAAAGRLLTTATTSRQIQLAAKIVW